MQKSPEFQKDCFLIRAPLATFDTIDLGDDLPTKSVNPSSSVRGSNKDSVEEKNISVRNETDNNCLKTVEEEESKPEALKSEKPSPKREFFKFDKKKDSAKKDSPKPDKRKGSPKKDSKGDKCKGSSKKESSKADKKKEKDNKKAKSNTKATEKGESPPKLPENVHVSVLQNTRKEAQACANYDYDKEIDNYVYIRHEPFIPGRTNDNISQEPVNGEGRKVETVFIPPPTSPNIPQLQRTSSFSSSSSDSDSELSHHAKCRSGQHHVKENEHVGNHSSQPLQSPLTLSPELVDPNSITSPSKRKAYQKRLWRQQVKTSPIARPRSTTPISVVTLDEYSSVLSSPENSPLSPTLHLGDKLKITLPADEFSIKSKSPRLGTNLSLSSEDNEESAFEFNEELLFTHTRSALIVDESGHIPSSPRRVLIPPTISPSTSPKLSTACVPGYNECGEASPRLVYIQATSEPSEEENWAVFADVPYQQDSVVEDRYQDWSEKPIYAQKEHELPLEEDILTVNISSSAVSGRRNIDIVLSSSSSSTSHSSPLSPDQPVTINPVTDQVDATAGGQPITDNPVTSTDQIEVAPAGQTVTPCPVTSTDETEITPSGQSPAIEDVLTSERDPPLNDNK